MATINNSGPNPVNRITISRSGAGRGQQINPDRSLAQPNPALPVPKVEPKAHASQEDRVDAIEKHSVNQRKYQEQKKKQEGKQEGKQEKGKGQEEQKDQD